MPLGSGPRQPLHPSLVMDSPPGVFAFSRFLTARACCGGEIGVSSSWPLRRRRTALTRASSFPNWTGCSIPGNGKGVTRDVSDVFAGRVQGQGGHVHA